MHVGEEPGGFTIIEVLIFLAVSALLFFVAVTFISGQSGTAEFEQSAHDVFSQLQNITNNVSVGFYSQHFTSNFSCSVTGNNPPAFATSGSNTEGTNGGASGCIFLGRVIQFAPIDSTYSLNTNNYVVYTEAGRQYQGSGGPNPSGPVVDFNTAIPTPVALANPITDADVVTTPYGIKFSEIYYQTSTQSSGGGNKEYTNLIGFFSNFAQVANNNSSAQLNSGAQGVSLVPLVAYPANCNASVEADCIASHDPTQILTSCPMTTTKASQLMSSFTNTTGVVPEQIKSAQPTSPCSGSPIGASTYSVVNPDHGVTICMNSGTSSQYATIQIGNSQNPFAMNLLIGSGSCT